MSLNNKLEQIKINQKKLAEKAGVSPSYMCRVLNGERSLTYDIAQEIYQDFNYNSTLPLVLEANGFCPCEFIKGVFPVGNEEIDELAFDLIGNFAEKLDSNKESDKEKMSSIVQKTIKAVYNEYLSVPEYPGVLVDNKNNSNDEYEYPGVLMENDQNDTEDYE